MGYYNEDTWNDKWINEEIFPSKSGGFFIEAGAGNGINASCTYFLEKEKGWSGILIEPNDFFFKDLPRNRPNSKCLNICLLAENGDDIEFIESNSPYYSAVKKNIPQYKEKFVYGGDSSSYKKTIKVGKSLLSILKENNAPKVIDYLALDIEGSEYEVLKNFLFDEYIFNAISIEGFSCSELLKSKGYKEVQNKHTETKWERYYIRSK